MHLFLDGDQRQLERENAVARVGNGVDLWGRGDFQPVGCATLLGTVVLLHSCPEQPSVS